MNLLTTNQYNQGVGKYKLLSSNAGVGAIITTKLGYYILVSDINQWDFIHDAQKVTREIRIEEADNNRRYDKAKFRLPYQGIEVIDDKRFIEFLKAEKELPELICLIAIPSISLNEQFNSPNWKNHPINRLLEGKGKAEQFMVKGTHFPKWFKNEKGELKLYSDWKRIWIEENNKTDNFVPPRDAHSPIKNQQEKVIFKTITDQDGVSSKIQLFKELNQTNLILICPNGHLSDVPWPKFLKWKTEKKDSKDNGADIFIDENCCNKPNLLWTESKTKSEGYGSIYIECLTCGIGSGKENKPKINLEGINNLKPFCRGDKPWEIDLHSKTIDIPHEDCYILGEKNNGREYMQLALVTGNNVYYANTFSSIYIPQHLAESKPKELLDAIIKCDEKYNRYSKVKQGITKAEFWEHLDKEDFIIDNDFQVSNVDEFLSMLKECFLNLSIDNQNIDRYEAFRWQEYSCFCSNSLIDNIKGLKFNDILLSSSLDEYFSKIQQVEELKLTQVQLDFTRVRPKERVKVEDKIIPSSTGRNIFSTEKNELFVLPANETFGEGLFFQFNEDKIRRWENELIFVLNDRYKNFFLKDVDLTRQGASIKQRIKNNGLKHFLIHTFSHILMRELEFSCGYPTASLKERLYISDRMYGVLIYTAEGSEGSMGGLVWQGQPERIQNLICKGLERSIDCSSDPLCWESEGQGIFDLNLAACFSCALVSETACEEMNLGLDRRILNDHVFGFFKNFSSHS